MAGFEWQRWSASSGRSGETHRGGSKGTQQVSPGCQSHCLLSTDVCVPSGPPTAEAPARSPPRAEPHTAHVNPRTPQRRGAQTQMKTAECERSRPVRMSAQPAATRDTTYRKWTYEVPPHRHRVSWALYRLRPHREPAEPSGEKSPARRERRLIKLSGTVILAAQGKGSPHLQD